MNNNISISKRKLLQSGFLLPSLLLFSEQSRAGAQIEEPMIDSVRSALSAAVNSNAPPIPEFNDTESRLKYIRWLTSMSQKNAIFKPAKSFYKLFGTKASAQD
jgi:hypothetical protein